MKIEEVKVNSWIANSKGTGIYEVVDLDQHPVWPEITLALLVELSTNSKKVITLEPGVLVNSELVD